MVPGMVLDSMCNEIKFQPVEHDMSSGALQTSPFKCTPPQKLTLEPFHAKSHCGHHNRGPFIRLLKVVHNGGFSTVIESYHKNVDLLLAHFQHSSELIE